MKKKSNKKFSTLEQMNDFQEFSNKYDLGKCVIISISKGVLLSSTKDIDAEAIKITLFSTIGNIYTKIIEANAGTQEVKDWVNEDIETSIWIMKKLYLSGE